MGKLGTTTRCIPLLDLLITALLITFPLLPAPTLPAAGLGWSFSTSSSGLTLKVHGYSDRLSTFASKLLALVIDPYHMVEDKLVDILKERKIRSLKSFHKERPDTHCNYYINSFLDPSRGDIDARVDAASRVTASHLREYLRAMLKPSNMFVEVRMRLGREWLKAKQRCDERSFIHLSNPPRGMPRCYLTRSASTRGI